MQAKTDAQLLREYARDTSDAAFGELVERHAGLVYSAALRQVGSPDGAQEIAQSVFIDLARKAPSLSSELREDSSLAGWLFRATRFAALTALRDRRRQTAHHHEFMHELQSGSEPTLEWEGVAPLLDEALSTLNEQEREALLLRFFENQDFRRVGAALGISDDTAQKRVSRSLEKLRAALSKQGVTTTSAALSVALTIHAVEVVPAGLSATWSSAALASAAIAVKSGAPVGLIKVLSMTKMQLGVGAVVVTGLVVTVALQRQSQSQLRQDNEILRQQVATVTANFESMSNRFAQSQGSVVSLPNDQFRELIRLRGEVGKLRDQTNRVKTLQEENRQLKSGVADGKDETVEAAKFDEYRQNVINTARMIGNGIRVWSFRNNDRFPTNFADMRIQMGSQTNFLDLFEMINVGKAQDNYPLAGVVREKSPRRLPLGGWERVYLKCDGSVDTAYSPNGNFDDWEAQNSINSF